MINHVKKWAFPILIKKWPMKYLLLTFTILVALSFPAWSFDNICPYKGAEKETLVRQVQLCAALAVHQTEEVNIVVGRYCKNVGKKAYNAYGIKFLREVYLGPIIGVAFKKTGEVLTGPGREVRYVEITGLYYIIGPGGVADYTFLRYGPEIEGR